MTQVPCDARFEARGRRLWTGRRFLLGVAIVIAVLAIGMTFVMVNLRSKLIARRNRLDQIARSTGVQLSWTDAVPFRHLYFRFFNRLPSSVADYVQDIDSVTSSDGDLDIPPEFFQDLSTFHRIKFIVWNNPQYSTELARLIGCQRNLERLVIVAQNLRDHDFECVGRFSNLTRLSVDGLQSPHLHGTFLRDAVGRTPCLERLYLRHMKLSQEACQSVGQLKSLKTITLNGCNLTSELASSLSGMPRLLYVDIDETLVDDEVGPTLATLTNLRFLRVKKTLMTTAGLEHLEHCPQLQLLETGGKRGGAKLLSHLCKCTKLASIDVVWSGTFSAADVANFNKFPDTGYLYFEDIGDEEADHLQQCEHVTGLDIHSKRITLSGVRSLMQMADLRHLKLDGQDWGPELVDVLYESPTLETVKILDRLWEWWEFEDLRVRLGAK